MRVCGATGEGGFVVADVAGAGVEVVNVCAIRGTDINGKSAIGSARRNMVILFRNFLINVGSYDEWSSESLRTSRNCITA
jgi:hypothetical protein